MTNTVPILFETPYLAALNKPNGLVVERDPHGYPSVEEWAKGQWPFVGIVHRLDRPVSGVLLVAKKKNALKNLNRQFEQRTVEKLYLAVVENPPPAPEGQLEHWIGRDPQNKRGQIQPAGTAGAVLARLDYRLVGALDDGTSLLEIRLHTGKFHQIRVQLSEIGCPIVGDEKYGATRPYMPDGIALHAWKLGLEDPVSGEPLRFEAPWPAHPLWEKFARG